MLAIRVSDKHEPNALNFSCFHHILYIGLSCHMQVTPNTYFRRVKLSPNLMIMTSLILTPIPLPGLPTSKRIFSWLSAHLLIFTGFIHRCRRRI